MSKKLVLIIVFITSALTLQLELLQTRILSFALWHHFVYIVITMALLGFAASGTTLSISSRLRRLSDSRFFFLCLMGFSFSSFFATRFAFFPVRNIFSLSPDLKIIGSLIITYTLSMIPYFFAGLIIGGSFIRFSKLTSILYFSNLLGSGLGCLSFIVLISPFGAPRLLFLTSLICLIPLMSIIQKRTRSQMIMIPWSLFLIIGLFLGEGSQLYQIRPESHKQFWKLFREETKIEYTEWNPISRIDVVSHAKAPHLKYILMDGDALAMLFNAGLVKVTAEKGMFSIGDRNAAYELLDKKPERVLVIGAGGGYDVLLAILKGAHDVDAVEINPTTVRLTSTLYSKSINDIYLQPNVKLFNEDGRSFVRRSKKRYDIIMMCATDTFLALSTGAYALLDNYLYTREALVDYIEHLSDDGFIQIGRWYYHQKPRETLRVFTTALEACRTIGIKNPLENIVVVATEEAGWADVIIKKKPFSGTEMERLLQVCSKYKYEILFSAGFHVQIKDRTHASPFLEFADHFSKGTERDFYVKYPYNVAPVSDNSPFFYQYDKWQHDPDKKFQHNLYDRIRGIWHIFVLSSLLIHAAILSFIFVLLPLIISRKKLGAVNINLFTLTYFLFIGLAFMFVEMSIVQKFVLFLGHPVHSMAIMIPTLLIFAGLGSLCSHRIQDRVSNYIFAATITSALLVSLVNYLTPFISNLFLMQTTPIRIAAVIITIAPLAFCMGFPFPLAIRAISSHSRELIPWAWAINGSSSVIASIVAVIIAMQSGFKMVLNLGAVFYIFAALSSVFLLIQGKIKSYR